MKYRNDLLLDNAGRRETEKRFFGRNVKVISAYFQLLVIAILFGETKAVHSNSSVWLQLVVPNTSTTIADYY